MLDLTSSRTERIGVPRERESSLADLSVPRREETPLAVSVDQQTFTQRVTRAGALLLGLLSGCSSYDTSVTPTPSTVPLPAKIQVKNTDLPICFDETGHKCIEPSKIDFDQNFYIETDRYTLVKKEDFFVSKLIGHIACIPHKVIMLDARVGWGLDGEETRRVLRMLEDDDRISGITVRLNHNAVWADTARLFCNEQIAERNNILARLTLGLEMTLGGQFLSEFSRTDYYNPMTQTAVVYSAIPSISAHEIGHHKDFQRFDSDWEYTLARHLAPVMLYQEARASLNASDILAPEDKWEFYRYLIPAFATYLIAAFAIHKRLAASDDGESVKNISAGRTLRHMLSSNAAMFGAIGGYTAIASLGMWTPLPHAAAFVGAVLAWGIVDGLLKGSGQGSHE